MDESRNKVEATYRRAAEQLAGDESLRDALTDEQAQQLLDWGLARLRHEMQRASSLPPEEAEAQVEKRVASVRQVMQQANRLVDGLPDAARGRTREYMLQFVEALCEIDSRAVHVNDMITLENLAHHREEVDRDTVFTRLMAIVRQEDEEE